MKYLFAFLFLLLIPKFVFAQNDDELNKAIRTVEGLFESSNVALSASSSLKINYDDISGKIDFVIARKISDDYSSKYVQSLYLDSLKDDSFNVSIMDLGDYYEKKRGTYALILSIKAEDDSVIVIREKFNKKEFPVPTSERTYRNEMVLNTFPSLPLSLIKKVVDNMAKIIGVGPTKYFMYNKKEEDYVEIDSPF